MVQKLTPLFDEEFDVLLPHFDMDLVNLCLEYYDKLLVNNETRTPTIAYLVARNRRQIKEEKLNNKTCESGY